MMDICMIGIIIVSLSLIHIQMCIRDSRGTVWIEGNWTVKILLPLTPMPSCADSLTICLKRQEFVRVSYPKLQMIRLFTAWSQPEGESQLCRIRFPERLIIRKSSQQPMIFHSAGFTCSGIKNAIFRRRRSISGTTLSAAARCSTSTWSIMG